MIPIICAVLFAALAVIFEIRALIYKVAMHQAIMVFTAYIEHHKYAKPTQEEIDGYIASINHNELASVVFGKSSNSLGNFGRK